MECQMTILILQHKLYRIFLILRNAVRIYMCVYVKVFDKYLFNYFELFNIFFVHSQVRVHVKRLRFL